MSAVPGTVFDLALRRAGELPLGTNVTLRTDAGAIMHGTVELYRLIADRRLYTILSRDGTTRVTVLGDRLRRG